MTRIEGLRLVAAFLLAPGAGVLVTMLGTCAGLVVASNADTDSCFLEASIFGVGAASIAYPATFIVGLPLFIVFRMRGWLKLWQVAVGGLIVAFVVGAIFSFPHAGMNATLWVMFCAVGLATGVAFWLIAIFRNRALTAGSSADAPNAARA